MVKTDVFLLFDGSVLGAKACHLRCRSRHSVLGWSFLKNWIFHLWSGSWLSLENSALGSVFSYRFFFFSRSLLWTEAFCLGLSLC